MSLDTPVAAAPCTGSTKYWREYRWFSVQDPRCGLKTCMCRCKLILYLTAGKILVLERSKEFIFHGNENIASAHGPVFWNHNIKQKGFSEVEWLANIAKFKRKCVDTALFWYTTPLRKLVSSKAWSKIRRIFPLWREHLESQNLLFFITCKNICL